MVTSINLYDKPTMTRHKVNDVITYNMLPQKSFPHCTIPQMLP